MTIKISVVIGTFQQVDVLRRVLDGFNCQTLAPDQFEVIVVDSGSTDGTAELLASFDATFRLNGIVQDNQGKSGARNRGISEAIAPIILITDADMIPHPELLNAHVNAHHKAKISTCFEGVTFNMTALHWPPNPLKLYPYIRESLRPNQSIGWHYFLTGNLSIPTRLIREMNGFDRDFTGYGWEDLELGYRLSKCKVPLRFLPQAINYHFHVVSEIDEIKRNIKKGESARIFLAKHPELKWFLGLNPLSVFVFRRIDETGNWMARMNRWLIQTGVRQRIAMWFLKEFYYLKGVLSPPTKQ